MPFTVDLVALVLAVGFALDFAPDLAELGFTALPFAPFFLAALGGSAGVWVSRRRSYQPIWPAGSEPEGKPGPILVRLVMPFNSRRRVPLMP